MMGITISQVRNAKSLQSNNARMDVEIKHPTYGWIPYTLDHSDTDSTINNDEIMALIGTDFAAYVAPTQAELDAVEAANIRAERDQLLVASDSMALADRITDDWRTYRQALRDLPAQSGFPNVSFPTPPSGA